MRQDPLGYQGYSRTHILCGLREVNAKSTCGHRKEEVARGSELRPWASTPQALTRTVDLHVNEAGRQDAAPAVPLLVGYEPLLKEELLWVQNAALAHPQILPADREGWGLASPAQHPAPSPRPPRPDPAPAGSTPAAPGPAPTGPTPHLSSLRPRRMRQLVNWSTGAREEPFPSRILSRMSRAQLRAPETPQPSPAPERGPTHMTLS